MLVLTLFTTKVIGCYAMPMLMHLSPCIVVHFCPGGAAAQYYLIGEYCCIVALPLALPSALLLSTLPSALLLLLLKKSSIGGNRYLVYLWSTFIGVGQFAAPVSLRSVHSEIQGFFNVILASFRATNAGPYLLLMIGPVSM